MQTCALDSPKSQGSLMLQRIFIKNAEPLTIWMAWGMLATSPLVFTALMRNLVAPYGRYSQPLGWGPLIPARVAWMTQEAPSFLVPAGLLIHAALNTPAGLAAHTAPFPRTALLACFLVHYAHRAFVYPLLVARGGKPTPLYVWCSALAFCAYNGLMQGLHLLYAYPDARRADALFWAGCALWALGWAVNLHSDRTLRRLRQPGETGYKIPTGGAFELVSAANYTGEIVEWAGFALASRSLPAVAFAAFTFANLGPRGAQHHRWYLNRFDDYPRHRRAVIPWLW